MNLTSIKKALFTLFFLCLISLNTIAQKPTVAFDYEKENFNENQPLPAETYFVITSPISVQVMAVEVILYRGKDVERKKTLFNAVWKRREGDQNQVFYLPINYKLRGSDEYDFVINYYRKVTAEEKIELSTSLNNLLRIYVDQAFNQDSKKIQLIKNTQQTVEEMNSIVSSALKRYQSTIGYKFQGFSDLVKAKIEQIEGQRMKKGEGDERELQRKKILAELVELLQLETSFVLNSSWTIIGDTKTVNSYPVEKTRNVLTLQIGYGGTYFNGNVDDLDYDTAPHIGLVLPLGNAAFASKFWSRSALVTGISLSNFRNQDDEEVTGPLFGRPIYAGYGYRIFRFVRLNAGVSLLEDNGGAGGQSRVYARPFVGISADIRLWLDLAK